MNQELADRIRSALRHMGALVNQGRRDGWLSGEQLPLEEDELAEGSTTSPLDLMAARLSLEPSELDVLWILACAEIDPRVACAATQLCAMGTSTLTVQLLEQLVALGGATLGSSSLTRLVQLGLIEMTSEPGTPRFRRTVRVNDRVVALARGEFALDEEVATFAVLESAIDAWRGIVPEAMPEVLRGCLDRTPFVVAYGSEGAGRATLLRQAIAARGHAVLSVRASDLGRDRETCRRQLRALVRECLLHGAWPLIHGLDDLADRASCFDQEVLARLDAPVFATAHQPCSWKSKRPIVSVPVVIPASDRRHALWRNALAGANEELLETCAERYTITPGILTAAAASLISTVRCRSAITHEDVHVALRAQLEQKLLGIATRIETRQTWQDLVLPVDQFDVLIELVSRIKNRKHVLEEWGFGEKVGRGVGTTALFSGPPGTGKTMIGGLIANELGLDLYQVDLSRVVSKYVGETEKQLATLFEAAESGHAIILFDEADSLFGKRTEVKSSNDRYANLEVNYLLQRMEAFRGITLLTTNHETAIDQAFQRRLAFHVRVPMPDKEHREMLWRSMMPERASCNREVDFSRLAEEFEMSGGYIKNAALRAAFSAADECSAIGYQHLRHAARAEYEAMGKLSYGPSA